MSSSTKRRGGLAREVRATIGAFLVVGSLTILAIGCGEENSLVDGTCADGFVACDLVCVDVGTRADHCGACGRVCPSGVACVEGVCGGGVDRTVPGDASPLDATTAPDADAPAVRDAGAAEDATVAPDAGHDGALLDAPSDAVSDVRTPDAADATVHDGGADGSTGPDSGRDAESVTDAGADATITADTGGDAAAILDAASDVVDACVGPFQSPLQCGDCTTVCPLTAPQCLLGDAGAFVCATGCAVSETLCRSTGTAECTNLDTDYLNCGVCGLICPSLLCSGGACQGSLPKGNIVVLGDDGTGVVRGTSPGVLFRNAVHIASQSTVRVLGYAQYAVATAVVSVNNVASAPTTVGGVATFTDVATPTALVTALAAVPRTADVVLFYDQRNAVPGDLTALGTQLAASLFAFTHAGGVVVVLDGADGTTKEMDKFLTSSGLLNVTSHTSVAPGTSLRVARPLSIMAAGVTSLVAAGAHVTRFVSPETVIPTTDVIVDEPLSGEANVVHKLLH